MSVVSSPKHQRVYVNQEQALIRSLKSSANFNIAMSVVSLSTPRASFMHLGIALVAKATHFGLLEKIKHNTLTENHVDTAYQISKVLEAATALRFFYGLCISDGSMLPEFYSLLTVVYLCRTYACIQHHRQYKEQGRGD